jgi:acyl-lipid omega-6 desaturase (Delta-12 desaturase)
MTAPFRGADDRRSAIQLAITFGSFAGLWYLTYRSLEVSYLLTLFLAIPTAGFLMRLFMIQHDCGHGSYFRSRQARDTVGFMIGVLTLIPYQYWRRTHAYHHAHAGDLDFRGFGDIDTLTVKEYLALSPMRRLGYRVYRNPILLLTVGPLFHFVVKHRYPWDIPRDWKQAWASVWWTNFWLVVLLVVAWQTIGLRSFFLVQAPVTFVTCAAGVWLFYVQHQFEETYWHRHQDWNYFEAAVFGSSQLVLPRPLQWITANIGIHQVHHLNAQIPNYRLEECLNANPALQQATRITFRDTFRLLGLALWDEDRDRLIPFKELPQATSVA